MPLCKTNRSVAVVEDFRTEDHLSNGIDGMAMTAKPNHNKNKGNTSKIRQTLIRGLNYPPQVENT